MHQASAIKQSHYATTAGPHTLSKIHDSVHSHSFTDMEHVEPCTPESLLQVSWVFLEKDTTHGSGSTGPTWGKHAQVLSLRHRTEDRAVNAGRGPSAFFFFFFFFWCCTLHWSFLHFHCCFYQLLLSTVVVQWFLKGLFSGPLFGLSLSIQRPSCHVQQYKHVKTLQRPQGKKRTLATEKKTWNNIK